MNEQVKRNLCRFPEDFMFRLSEEEAAALRSQSAILKTGRGQHLKYLPYAFTEQGVAMLSSVLNSDRAVEVNIAIMRAFVRLPNSVFKPYASIGTNLLFFEKGEPTQNIWFYEHRVPDGQKAYSMTKPIRIEHFAPCVKWWGGAKRKGRKETEVAWKVSADEVKARGYDLDFKNPTRLKTTTATPRSCCRRSTRPKKKPPHCVTS